MESPQIPARRTFEPNASLVLVGIRGSGKRSLGFLAATALKRRFITEEHYFKEVTGVSRLEYLKVHGNQQFHSRYIDVLQSMLDNHRTDCVIECGLGSFTRIVQDRLREYSKKNPIIHLVRDIDEIQQQMPGMDEQSVDLLRKGDPLHRTCSDFEFYNLKDRSRVNGDDGSAEPRSAAASFKLQEVKEDLARFVRFVLGVDVNHSSYASPFELLETPPELRSFTHAILVRSSDLIDDTVNLQELESGGDAIELCVDLCQPDMHTVISKQVAVLRRNARIPVILSVDTSSTSLNRTDLTAFYIGILEHGLRLAVEYLVVDLGQDDFHLEKVIRSRGHTKIIGQRIFESSSRFSWNSEECLDVYSRAEKLGCQIVRLLRVAKSRDENTAVVEFTSKIRALPGNHPPLIAYNIGPLGRTSQVFNSILTNVTHKAITRQAISECDPQITSQDAIKALFQSYVLDPLHFYILGANVTYSLSPFMHNGAYQACGMGHKYRIPESPSLAVLDEFRRDPNFGGSSVVQPWRVELYHKLAAKSRHAEAIGAINTIMPLRGTPEGEMYSLQEQANRRNQAGPVLGWYGENTDWIGIMTCLNRHLSPRNAISAKTTGLVIGAGGMARSAIYAMLRLGCRKIFIYNRTLSRAQDVANHFNSWASSQVASAEVVRVLRSTQDDWPEDASPPTLVVSGVPADPDREEPPANFEMPLPWLGSPTGGVIIELAYKPLDTSLLQQMRRFRNSTGRSWALSDGLENVIEQGIAQFELMTGRKAPRRLMALEVLRNYEDENGRLNEKTIQARLDGVFS